MFFTKILVGASAVASLIVSAYAVDFNPDLKTNVAMYYGSGPNENLIGGLEHFCQQANSPDVIPLGFINRYLAQGDGYPGSDFAGSCFADVYAGPGYPTGDINTANDHLYTTCPSISNGIATCQSAGKKILLSLGGDPSAANYQLTSLADGINMANFLWNAFGPKDASWTGPRPFDYNGVVNVVDGFDFDIETIVAGEQQYYIAMIEQLRTYFDAAKLATGRDFYISGAPQCAVPDTQMNEMIVAVKFDLLFVQFYNTPQCSARKWVTSNPNYATTHKEVSTTTSGFTFDAWVNATNVVGSKSSEAKIYIGVLGNTNATTATTPGTYYLDAQTEVKPLVEAYYCKPNFGGVMIWEAAYAENNVANGMNFYQQIKTMLTTLSTDAKDLTCVASSTTSSSSTTTSTTVSATPTCGTGCITSYTVVSGDTCFEIATDHGLTLDQFTALNPQWTTTTCPSLPIGAVVCLKGQTPCSTTTTKLSTSASSTSKLSSSTSTGKTTTSSSSTSKPASTSTSKTTTSSSSTSKPASTSTSKTTTSSSSTSKPASTTTSKTTTSSSSTSKPASTSTSKTTTSSSSTSKPASTTTSKTTTSSSSTSKPASTSTSKTTTSSSSTSKPASTSTSKITTSSSSTSKQTSVSSSTSHSVTSISSTVLSSSSTVLSSAVISTSASSSSSSSILSTSSTSTSASSSSIVSSSTTSTPISSSSISSTSVSSSSSVVTSSVAGVSVSSSSIVSTSATSTASSSSSSLSSTLSSATSATASSITGSTTTDPEGGKGVATSSVSSISTTSLNIPSTTPIVSATSSVGSSNSSGIVLSSTTNAAKSTTITSATSIVNPGQTSSSTHHHGHRHYHTRQCNSSVSHSHHHTHSYRPTSTGAVKVSSSTGTVKLTTSTIYTTSVYTVTSCAPTVTDCPGRLGQVTTEIIPVTTTVCPVTEGETSPTSTPSSGSGSGVGSGSGSSLQLTTSKVYTTKVYTITSCAATVTDCPGKIGQITTEVIELYTTVCPVSAILTAPASPVETPAPSAAAITPTGNSPSGGNAEEATTTLSSTSTQYITRTIAASITTSIPSLISSYVYEVKTMSVVPIPFYSTPASALSLPAVETASVLSESSVSPSVPTGGAGEAGVANPSGTGVYVPSKAPISTTSPIYTGAATRSSYSFAALCIALIALGLL